MVQATVIQIRSMTSFSGSFTLRCKAPQCILKVMDGGSDHCHVILLDTLFLKILSMNNTNRIGEMGQPWERPKPHWELCWKYGHSFNFGCIRSEGLITAVCPHSTGLVEDMVNDFFQVPTTQKDKEPGHSFIVKAQIYNSLSELEVLQHLVIKFKINGQHPVTAEDKDQHTMQIEKSTV